MLLYDLYWPLRVVMQGRRVVYDRRALAYDRLLDRPADELRRKVRTLSGNFQLTAMLPQALIPWRNPIWVQFISHKILRLIIPWILLAVPCASGVVHTPLYLGVFLAQLLFIRSRGQRARRRTRLGMAARGGGSVVRGTECRRLAALLGADLRAFRCRLEESRL